MVIHILFKHFNLIGKIAVEASQVGNKLAATKIKKDSGLVIKKFLVI